MKKKVRVLVNKIKKKLMEIYGDKIKQVIVYGSYARGEETEDSDIDILIVIDNNLNPTEVEESINDFLFKILLEEGDLCSVMAIPEKLFKNYNSPFLLNVKEEGVSIEG